jgi:pyruvate dehydrogenase E2 component (dihydrolipoyllysine-residue acetyltransferase)
MFTVEGSVGRWLRGPGELVEAGEAVVEIQTEKVTFEVEAPASGFLHPVAIEGSAVVIEGLLGWILAEGEAVPSDDTDRRAATRDPARHGSPSVLGPAGLRAGGRPPAPLPTPRRASDGESTEGSTARVVASPAARRLAAEKGVDLSQVTGTGPGGRIVEADVVAAAKTGGGSS